MRVQEPTLFIHGYSGTYFSFRKMLKRFAKNHWGEKSCIVIISRTGQIYFWGRPRSLIQVLFLENRDNVAHQVNWIWKLLNQLKTNYGISHVNLVAHSMGCVSVLLYLNQYGYDDRNSKVKRVVTIGAPFNDVEVGKRTPYIEDHPLTTTGPVEMSPLYRWLKANNIGMPADVRFLNIAGNLQNGTFSDGQVSVNSALSLRYLVRDVRRQYQEYIIHGKRAEHSLLHENEQVDQIIGKFLTH
ncbi:alpha/beta fold hydrolase [Ligilactobacillus araffinosus]|uniref:Alpha/beta hydrolase n=1 Tax=Ligilactobacillus araffinosus DSM 20653 TaxID=1423820 RepID=A0A0R1ZDH1_9LACO|nr:alpha/beta fold hydrolase [Ligilactobacillus araffinosus]KRM52782.1 hypothetical protein FC64_GL000246 [Ligilactobacillus araffinosus DSM 20653]